MNQPSRPRLGAGLLIALTWLVILPAATWAAMEASTDLASQIQAACQTRRGSRLPAEPGPWRDLELDLLARGLAAAGRSGAADQVRRYLKDYFSDSPLAAGLPPIPDSTPSMPVYEPDPDFSRLVKSAFHDITTAEQPEAQERFAGNLAQILPVVIASLDGFRFADWAALVREAPEAPYAGWAAYQMAWAVRLGATGADTALRRLGQDHPQHPLGREAVEASGVPYYAPASLAWKSALVPGLGERILEPELSEFSGIMYSELLYLSGAVGLLVAAQQGSRPENLVGALIFANLLFLNHQGSAEHVYAMAQRRNAAEQRRFIAERLEQRISGTGRFQPPAPEGAQPPLADQGVIGLDYSWVNIGHAWRGQGLIAESELANIGVRIELLRSVWDFWRGDVVASALALAPRIRFLANQASGQDEGPSLAVAEWAAGVEAAWLLRVSLGDPWLQLRLSAGPAFRGRTLAWGSLQYAEHGPALSFTLAIESGGPAGYFWSLGLSGDDSFLPASIRLNSREVSLPSRSLNLGGSLGLRF